MTDYLNLPDFDSLPRVKDMPQGCAWGVFDKDGEKDQLGCLNLLTPRVVRGAFKEAREGISVSLNWPMGAIAKPAFGRKGLEHKVLDGKSGNPSCWAFEDEVTFNTQCSSQWDSLVHYAHQPTGLNYNGSQPSRDQFVPQFGNTDAGRLLPTLDHWHDRGCVVGRGVLIDYREFAQKTGITYSCFDAHAITVADLEAVARYQGTEFKHGDILIIRTGYTEDLGSANAEEQQRMLCTQKAVGVKGCVETARWIWNHHFSAVAGDSIAFEVAPPTIEEDDDRTGTMAELVLHQYFLSLFGLSIGELWDLKALSERCKQLGRYEFLFTSAPLNIAGALGSPPNALAIF